MKSNHARAWQQDYVSHAPQKQKKIVVKVKKQGLITKGEKVLYSFVGLIFIIASLYIVSFSSTTDTLNRSVLSLEQTVVEKEVTNENLLFEIKELSKPERITQIAKDNGLKIQNTEVKKANALNN